MRFYQQIVRYVAYIIIGVLLIEVVPLDLVSYDVLSPELLAVTHEGANISLTLLTSEEKYLKELFEKYPISDLQKEFPSYSKLVDAIRTISGQIRSSGKPKKIHRRIIKEYLEKQFGIIVENSNGHRKGFQRTVEEEYQVFFVNDPEWVDETEVRMHLEELKNGIRSIVINPGNPKLKYIKERKGLHKIKAGQQRNYRFVVKYLEDEQSIIVLALKPKAELETTLRNEKQTREYLKQFSGCKTVKSFQEIVLKNRPKSLISFGMLEHITVTYQKNQYFYFEETDASSTPNKPRKKKKKTTPIRTVKAKRILTQESEEKSRSGYERGVDDSSEEQDSPVISASSLVEEKRVSFVEKVVTAYSSCVMKLKNIYTTGIAMLDYINNKYVVAGFMFIIGIPSIMYGLMYAGFSLSALIISVTIMIATSVVILLDYKTWTYEGLLDTLKLRGFTVAVIMVISVIAYLQRIPLYMQIQYGFQVLKMDTLKSSSLNVQYVNVNESVQCSLEKDLQLFNEVLSPQITKYTRVVVMQYPFENLAEAKGRSAFIKVIDDKVIVFIVKPENLTKHFYSALATSYLGEDKFRENAMKRFMEDMIHKNLIYQGFVDKDKFKKLLMLDAEMFNKVLTNMVPKIITKIKKLNSGSIDFRMELKKPTMTGERYLYLMEESLKEDRVKYYLSYNLFIALKFISANKLDIKNKDLHAVFKDPVITDVQYQEYAKKYSSFINKILEDMKRKIFLVERFEDMMRYGRKNKEIKERVNEKYRELVQRVKPQQYKRLKNTKEMITLPNQKTLPEMPNKKDPNKQNLIIPIIEVLMGAYLLTRNNNILNKAA